MFRPRRDLRAAVNPFAPGLGVPAKPPPLSSPAVSALLSKRVRDNGVVLFDLDDTLVVTTEVTRSEPLVSTHRGYATVIQLGEASCFVAVRAFALASIALLHEAGLRVGFWSAGSPAYVSAVAERLIDAVRQMQWLRHHRRTKAGAAAQAGVAAGAAEEGEDGEDDEVGAPAGMKALAPPPNLFVPIAVLALDQQAMVWVHDTALETRHRSAKMHSVRYRPLAPAPFAIKHIPSVVARHPRLATSLPHALLIDNLPHDPEFTLHVQDFRPEVEDKELMHIARRILKAQREARRR